jgi:organic hydroperoxide reductase OsmC/OhrA
MGHTATYPTLVNRTGDGFLRATDAQGHAGVFTPEDAFVAAANTCVMMMFIWAAERFKLKLIAYECRTEAPS